MVTQHHTTYITPRHAAFDLRHCVQSLKGIAFLHRRRIATAAHSPYLCTFDLVKQIYDMIYFTCNDIWNAEAYLNKRFKSERMSRNMPSRHLFQNYNMIGRNRGQSAIDALKLKKLL